MLEDNGGEDVINKSLLFIKGVKSPTLPVIAWFHRPEIMQYLANHGVVEKPLSRWFSRQHEQYKNNGRPKSFPFPQDALGKQINDLLCNGDTRYLNFYGPPG